MEQEKKKFNKKIFVIIGAVILLSIIIFICVSNRNPYKISTSNIKLSQEVKEKVNDDEIEKLLYNYIIAEIELYNNNEKNTVIEQTDDTQRLIDKIMSNVDNSKGFNWNLTKEQLELQVIYLGITEISRTMLLEQPVTINLGSSTYVEKNNNKLTDEQYKEYMNKVKESIENVINEYCQTH